MRKTVFFNVQQRYQIISAKVEPNDEECVWESEEESERASIW